MSTIKILDDLTEWLYFQCDCYDLYPIGVTIGNRKYIGCHYKQNRTFNDNQYIHEAWFILGDLPLNYKHSARQKYTFNNQVFYIMSYQHDINMAIENAHFNPNVLMFQLGLCNSDKPIDYYN